MSNNVVFEDYSVKVKDVLKEKAIAFLYEIGGEIRSITERNSDPYRKTGQTADSYQYKVDEGELAVHIGSDYENAIWEEFGTGEYAINGDGRKGWWVYIKGGGTGTGGKNYSTKAEAKKAMAILRSKGLEAYYTKGKSARRPLYNAYNQTKPKIEQVARRYFGGI